MKPHKNTVWLAVLVSALGYLVDIYDILIFSVVRSASLQDIGVPQHDWTSVGLAILNWQLLGMLVGGLLWGVLGDKKGRVTVLFGSIFLYSAANIANAFVVSAEQYALLRFIAGVGLAGELGAGVTLVSELLPARSRGYGTMTIASVGVLGAVLAGILGQTFHWKTCYIIGGVLGFVLLFIRVGVMESGLFKDLLSQPVARGSLRQLLGTPSLRARFLRCLFLAVPAWILIGLFTTLAPEIGKEMGLFGTFTAAQAILYLNIGIGIGDFTSSLVSQFLRSRKRAIGGYLIALTTLTLLFAFAPFTSTQQLLWLYFALGICAGYWAVFMMTTAEQFGTNLRATVTTSTPNLVRATIVPISLATQSLKSTFGYRGSLALLLCGMLAIAFYALWSMKETFSADLNFVET